MFRRTTALLAILFVPLVTAVALAQPASAAPSAKPVEVRLLSATLTASPNPATIGADITFTGSGYTPSEGVTLQCQTPYANSTQGGPADANGDLTLGPIQNLTQQAGTVTCQAGYVVQHGQKVTFNEVASTEFTVV